jgi:delta 1-pyrroline-5-carboxylate dehydrogenase
MSGVKTLTVSEDEGEQRLDRWFTGAGEWVAQIPGVGKALLKQSSDALLRTSMELGGNAPFVVFDDADVDAAVEGAMLAKMRNGGEACTAANRLYVANDLLDDFTDKFVKKMGELTLGNGLDPTSKLGPLVNPKQVASVQELVDDAVEKGALNRQTLFITLIHTIHDIKHAFGNNILTGTQHSQFARQPRIQTKAIEYATFWRSRCNL